MNNYFGNIIGPESIDQNIAAKKRFLQDSSPLAVNLGIGEICDHLGKPWNKATAYVDSLNQLVKEVGYNIGSYMNPHQDTLEKAKTFLLDFLHWQI